MRAINIFFIFILLYGCTTIQVAEVVTKTSIKVAEVVTKTTKIITISKEEDIKENEDILKKEKGEITQKKKIGKAVSMKQQKISTIKLLGKTLDELLQEIGNPSLIREDGNTKTVRFDTSSCRLFVYFNKSDNKKKVEYYEIRNINGNLIDRKENINKCFKEIKKV